MKINLRDIYAFEDDDTRVAMFLNEYAAYDPQTGAYLMRSKGRRKSGRNRRYYARGCGNLVRFTAANDAEAIEKANKRLNAELAKSEYA